MSATNKHNINKIDNFTDFVGTINIAFHVEADWIDQLKACYHAEVIEYCYSVAQQNAMVRYRFFVSFNC